MTVRTVLVLSAGSGVGHGVITALRLAPEPFRIVGLNSVAAAAGLFECDAAYLTPPTDEGERFIARLERIVAAERPAMIVAGRDADLPLLAAAKPALEALGAFALTGSAAAAAVCIDKRRQAEVLHAAGLPFARTAGDGASARRLAAEAGYPILAKPRIGHSSINVRVIRDEHDLDAALAATESTVFQEYLMPDEWRDNGTLPDTGLRQEDEYSIQLLLGRAGELLGVFASRNRLAYGAPIFVEVVHDPAIEALAAVAAWALADVGVLGPCNLQARRVRGRYVVFEVNARFTGITPVRARMGYREVEAAYRYFVDGLAPGPLLAFDRRQVAMRYLTESIFSTAALDELTRCGQWRASS